MPFQPLRRVDAPSRARRIVLGFSAIAVAVVPLTGCGATAPTLRSAGALSSVAASTVGEERCGAASAQAQPLDTVAYATLPRPRGFTKAVAAASGRVVALGARTVSFRDFLDANDRTAQAERTDDGGVLGPAATGLIGAGVKRTVLQVAPGTSNRADDIPSVFPQTNQLDVLRVRGDDVVLRGFTVRGTAQGHLYNGLRIDQTRDLRASRLKVVGIPGDDVQPPGETFGVNDYRTVGSVWSDVEVDGAGVGASGFGVNSSRDITLCRVRSHDNRVAMGFAFWQTRGIRLVDCVAADNGFSGFNFERVGGSTVLVRPSATGNRYGMRIGTDRVSGKYTIIDPHLTDGRWTVALPTRWYGTANKQKASDVQLVVDGRLRPDLLRIVRY